MPEFPYADFESLVASIGDQATLLVLDRIHDSHNFGAMVRSAVGLGVNAVLVGEAEQSAVNRQVVQSSAGAVNLVPIARVVSLQAALSSLQARGVCIVAASEKADCDLFTADLRTPLVIIVGNEGRGVDPALSRCARSRSEFRWAITSAHLMPLSLPELCVMKP
ncbi:MAG: TrmH family RNA methyltransferase [Chitinophagaceae bacterium]